MTEISQVSMEPHRITDESSAGLVVEALDDEHSSTFDTYPLDIQYTNFSDENLYDIEGIDDSQMMLMEEEEEEQQQQQGDHDLESRRMTQDGHGDEHEKSQAFAKTMTGDRGVLEEKTSREAENFSDSAQQEVQSSQQYQQQSSSLEQGHHESDTVIYADDEEVPPRAELDLDFTAWGRRGQELALEINALLSDVIGERQYRRTTLEKAAAPLVARKNQLLRQEAALSEKGAQVKEQGQRLMQGYT